MHIYIFICLEVKIYKSSCFTLIFRLHNINDLWYNITTTVGGNVVEFFIIIFLSGPIVLFKAKCTPIIMFILYGQLIHI